LDGGPGISDFAPRIRTLSNAGFCSVMSAVAHKFRAWVGQFVGASCAGTIGGLPSAFATLTKKVLATGDRSRKQRPDGQEGCACGNCLKRRRLWPLLRLSCRPEWRRITSHERPRALDHSPRTFATKITSNRHDKVGMLNMQTCAYHSENSFRVREKVLQQFTSLLYFSRFPEDWILQLLFHSVGSSTPETGHVHIPLRWHSRDIHGEKICEVKYMPGSHL
jgi:hypothetical protein